MRRLSSYNMGRARNMRVIERLMISRDAAVLLVQVGQRILAISSAKDGVRLLCELSPRDLPDISEERRPGPPDENSTFWQRFSHNMRINLRLLPKDTPYARPPGGDDAHIAPPPAPSPSPFAMALLRAQSESDRDGLMSLLDTAPDPISVLADADGNSGSSSIQDYNAAIENLKQMGQIGSAPDVSHTQTTPLRGAGAVPGNAEGFGVSGGLPSTRGLGDAQPGVPQVVPITTTAAASAYKNGHAPAPLTKGKIIPAIAGDDTYIVPGMDTQPPRGTSSAGGGVGNNERDSLINDKVDELFDKISKRSDRYTKKE